MDRRSPAPSCGDLRQADETKAHHAGFVIGASISAYCPDQAPPRSVNVRTTDSELRLVATLRRAAREQGGPLPSTDVADALLDERLRAERIGVRGAVWSAS
jgi:hypothetical protein